jgi:hypothetical protein
LLETGLLFSRYAVKLSSLQRISGWVARGVLGKMGLRGEFDGVREAACAMLHIGQPGFGAKDMMVLQV